MIAKNVKTVLKAIAETQTKITAMLWGRHGIGKSSIVHQLGRELGYKVITLILSQKEAVDVAGVLYTYEDPALGMSVTSAHPPVWFAEACKTGKLILFLDEINMARREVSNAAFEIILDRRLNNTYLPDDVLIVCAGNPDDKRYDVTPMTESLKDRLMHIHVTPDVDSWLQFAKTPDSGIHPDVAKFIEADPKAAYKVDDEDSGFPLDTMNHSFRSWERVGLVHKLPISYALKTECIRGIVGPDLAVAFMKAYGSKDIPLDALEILELSENTKRRINEYKRPEKMRVDLLSASVDNLVRFVNKNAGTVLKRVANVKEFIRLLPDGVAGSALSQLCQYDGFTALFEAEPDLKAKLEEARAALTTPKQVA